MIEILLILLATIPSQAASKSGFDKVSSATPAAYLLEENSSMLVKLDNSLQDLRQKSPASLRYSVGMPLERVAIGPSAQMDLVRKLKNLPFYLSTGVGYTLETRKNSDGESRNYHYLPFNLSLGAERKFLNLNFILEAGPSYRFTFERGFTPEQRQDYSYLDLQGFLGISYDWTRPITESGREIGIRYQRYFGLLERDAAPPLAILFGYMAWDI